MVTVEELSQACSNFVYLNTNTNSVEMKNQDLMDLVISNVYVYCVYTLNKCKILYLCSAQTVTRIGLLEEIPRSGVQIPCLS